MKVKLPRSITAAAKELEGLNELLKAKEWHRAAIVAAFVRLPGSGSGQTVKAPFDTAAEFAARGISGLRSEKTVRLYVQNWLDVGGDYPAPGRSVTLPDLDWPPTRTGTDGYESEEGAARTIERLVERHGPNVIASAVRRPEVARAVVDDFEASTEVIRQSHTPTPSSPRPQGGVVGEMDKLLIQIGAMGYEDFGEKLLANVRDHEASSTPWKPKEQEAVLKAARAGVQHGQNVIALLTVDVSDEAIQDLISKG